MGARKVIEMQGVYKYFGNFCANENVDFDLEEGEIHALLGENGAGKSTLMNVLYGLYSHDQGIVKIMGEEVHIKSPIDSIVRGIGMVHQHFMLIPQLTVTQNIFLGMKEAGFILSIKKLENEVKTINNKYGFNVNPSALIMQLPVGVQQKVEILKVLMRKAKILILDEPTAVLTPSEVEELFSSMKKLTKQGYSVVLITHKMEEVLMYCDRVTVLRTGKVIGTMKIKDSNSNELTTMMVGREVSLERKIKEQTAGDMLLDVKDLVVNSDK
jgi:simple sugar transport system ATP-binding protein